MTNFRWEQHRQFVTVTRVLVLWCRIPLVKISKRYIFIKDELIWFFSYKIFQPFNWAIFPSFDDKSLCEHKSGRMYVWYTYNIHLHKISKKHACFNATEIHPIRSEPLVIQSALIALEYERKKSPLIIVTNDDIAGYIYLVWGRFYI